MELVEFGAEDVVRVDVYSALVNQCEAVDGPPGPLLTRARQQAIMRHGWDGEPGRYFLGFVDGEPVGTLEVVTSERDNRESVWLTLRIRPDRRRSGFGTGLLEAAIAHARQACRPLVGVEGWDQQAMRGFAASAGFEVRQVSVARDLVLTRTPAERQRFASLRDQAAAHSLAYDLQRIDGRTPPELLAALVEATKAINDAPLDDLDYEDEVYDIDRICAYEDAQLASGNRFRRIVALDRATGAVAGHTILVTYADQPTYGEQHDTTVVAAHRGHRLGLRLKADMACWLAEIEPDLVTIQTENAASNAPMIAVNEALGCKVVGRRLLVQRRV